MISTIHTILEKSEKSQYLIETLLNVKERKIHNV